MTRTMIWMSAVCAALLLLGGCVSTQRVYYSETDSPSTQSAVQSTATAIHAETTAAQSASRTTTEQIVTTRSTFSHPATAATVRTFAKPHPEVFAETEKEFYRPDEKVILNIRDNANVGYRYWSNFELWEQSGDTWVQKFRIYAENPIRRHRILPHPYRSYQTTASEIYLTDFEDVQFGKRYKIVFRIEGFADEIVSAEFSTVAKR